MTRRKRRPPWWVSAAGLTLTFAVVAWLIAEVAGMVLRIVGAR